MTNKQKQGVQSLSTNKFGDKQQKPTNLLKFVNQKNSFKRSEGKRCRPQQMFGYGYESPDHFKAKHSLKADNQYIYRFDENPQNKNFEYISQKNFYDIGKQGSKGQLPKNKTQFLAKFEESAKNKVAFHRRKGRLSQFMDKNGWMSKNIKIMGFQRCKTARQFCNRDIQKKIQKKNQEMAQKQKGLTNLSKSKTKYNTNHSKFGQILITQKMKTREMRNQFATLQIRGSQQLRPNTTMSLRSRSSILDTENKITRSVKLADNRIHDFEVSNEMWNKDDRKRANLMQMGKPNKTDEWMQTTCGSKFSNPQTMLTNRKIPFFEY